MIVAESFGIADKNNNFVAYGLTETDCITVFKGRKLKTGIYYFVNLFHCLNGTDKHVTDFSRYFVVL